MESGNNVDLFCPRSVDLCMVHASRSGVDIERRMMSELVHKLHSTTDAKVWAEEFCKLFTVIDKNNLTMDDQEGLMIGWFANAIEIGRGAGLSEVEEWKLRYIEVTNPGINMDEVRTSREQVDGSGP